MSKDILSETFQKHLKLLHKHLNINEAYGDAAHLDYVKNRQTDRRVDWDPDGVTGTRYDEPYRSPETISDYAKKVDWDDSMIQTYVYWLNNVWKDSRGGWHRDSTYNGMGDSHDFHSWIKNNAEEFKDKQEKELENKIERISDYIKIPMASVIKSFGLIPWQKYKRKNIKEKISTLAFQAANNEEKIKKEFGNDDLYDTLIKYLNEANDADIKHDADNQKMYIDLITTTIEKAEKMLGRGFFEQ